MSSVKCSIRNSSKFCPSSAEPFQQGHPVTRDFCPVKNDREIVQSVFLSNPLGSTPSHDFLKTSERSGVFEESFLQ